MSGIDYVWIGIDLFEVDIRYANLWITKIIEMLTIIAVACAVGVTVTNGVSGIGVKGMKAA